MHGSAVRWQRARGRGGGLQGRGRRGEGGTPGGGGRAREGGEGGGGGGPQRTPMVRDLASCTRCRRPATAVRPSPPPAGAMAAPLRRC